MAPTGTKRVLVLLATLLGTARAAARRGRLVGVLY
jgi:hypothetical protein